MVERKYFQREIEKMPLKDLKKLQLRRLRATLRHAYRNNKIYREKMKNSKVHPEDIKTLEDLQKVPFLTKDELRKYYPMGLMCVPVSRVVEMHASSGTTGKPVVAIYTRKDVSVWEEVMARNLYTNGLRERDILQNAYGYGLFTGAHGFERGAQKIGAMVVPTSSGNTRRQVQMMADMGTTALACTPSYSLYMAEVAEDMGYDPKKKLNVKIGHFGAEAWSEEIRKSIEDAWELEAFDHYGLTEIIGPGVSTECSEHNGLHINADHFICEVIDPETGEVLGPEEEGELVFTTITKEAFPSIRFRTKDLSLLIEEKCNCGRTLPRHTRIKGRADDMMKIKGVIVFPKQIEEAILHVKGTSENYLIIKKKEGPFWGISVKVEPTKSRYKRGNLEILAKNIEDEIYKILNLKVPVEIVPPGSIPRSEGKAKRVIVKE